MTLSMPLVWLPADHRLLGKADRTAPFLVLGDKYARAVKVNAAAQPVVFALADGDDVDALLDVVDGVMLTGSPSNVHPSHFGAEVANPALPLDPQRDALTLRLVTACLHRAIPLLGVCRGFQEINVALGGSLHQQVQNIPGMQDHREVADQTYEMQYAPSHSIAIAPGSVMARWAGGTNAQVNSLHGQGVDQLAQGLRALAHAQDGLVEAFEVAGAESFAVAVQWHPEWRTSDNPFYSAIFAAFGDACRAYRAARFR
jgi:putative glutamine amidotransferase